VHQVGKKYHYYIRMHGQQNIKKKHFPTFCINSCAETSPLHSSVYSLEFASMWWPGSHGWYSVVATLLFILH